MQICGREFWALFLCLWRQSGAWSTKNTSAHAKLVFINAGGRLWRQAAGDPCSGSVGSLMSVFLPKSVKVGSQIDAYWGILSLRRRPNRERCCVLVSMLPREQTPCSLFNNSKLNLSFWPLSHKTCDKNQTNSEWTSHEKHSGSALVFICPNLPSADLIPLHSSLTSPILICITQSELCLTGCKETVKAA